MKKTLRALALAAVAPMLVLAPALLTAQTAPPIKFETFTLANGLKFVMHEDHSTPIIAVNVYYDTGSANEELGRSGFAHLFEHLMFQESANMGKGDFDKWMDAAGTSNNGTTDQDRTLYFEVVPSNRINLALWMEA